MKKIPFSRINSSNIIKFGTNFLSEKLDLNTFLDNSVAMPVHKMSFEYIELFNCTVIVI